MQHGATEKRLLQGFLDGQRKGALKRAVVSTGLNYVLLALCAGPLPAFLFALAPAGLACAVRRRQRPHFALAVLVLAVLEVALLGFLVARAGLVVGTVAALVSGFLALRAAASVLLVHDPLLDAEGGATPAR